MSGLELTLQLLALRLRVEKEIAFNPLEIAIDVFHRCDCLDAMYGGHVTFGCQPSAFLAMELCDVEIAVVESGSEMSGGTARLAAANLAIVDQHDGTSSAREKVGGGHAGDARSNNTDIRAQILVKRLELWNFGCAHPDGGRMT
jgi:hypothetical protein